MLRWPSRWPRSARRTRRPTLDSLERDVIGGFGDARALLALSRGAQGGPRLKSEAYTSDRLNAQLRTMAGELVDHRQLVRVDAANNTLSVNPIFSWREDVFVKSTAGKAPEVRMVFHDFDWRLNDLTAR